MMADPNKKKPTPPEIIVEATDWPHFLRTPVDPAERVRRAWRAADELREQIATRKLCTETLHRAIARSVAHAMKSGEPRKRIIFNAMRSYGVGERTVETAIKKFPKEF
jgi:hypothetical protein